ncbi:hypothetical protein HK104_010926 [Borealophlyctis nickersoniae]|nr:hypothetical protein HK104_010926 [Borealophlyctis nickersoniae]
MYQRTTCTAPLPPELLREVVLVTDQRTVLTLRHSSKLCKLFAEEVILSYAARHADNFKITLSTLVDGQTPSSAATPPEQSVDQVNSTTLWTVVDAQTPSPATTPPVQSVGYVGSRARFDRERRTVTVDLFLAPRNQTIPSDDTWLRDTIDALNEVSMTMSDIVEEVPSLRKARSTIRNLWSRVVKKHDVDGAVSIKKLLRKKASKVGTVQLTLQKEGARLQRYYDKAAGEVGNLLQEAELFAPFLVPVAAPSQTLTLTAKGRCVIRARTRPAAARDGIPSLISGTIMRHPRRVHDRGQDQHGGGGDDECRGAEVRIVMGGFKSGENVEVLGFRMEMNVASALLLGGFDAMKASVGPSTAAAVST